ncbi:aldehyde dehydrogenase family protein [Pseudomonas oryzihabitans]|uniref:aldehyde dehydrogenase family protein n=1 Tax=Pseudomonas oryzihabitans TaxID=47885 RepID=UPI002898E03D|nr:aldehyde dehydrogenase family protein [Pseudomonas oryzihabitans]
MPTTALLAPLDRVTAFLDQAHGSFIDGQTVRGSKDTTEVFDPATGQPIARTHQADDATVARCVTAARAAFEAGSWSRQRPADRERILLRFADLVEQHGEELAQLETLEQGKSIHIARAIEVGGSVEYMRYMAGWATKLEGQTLDVSIPVPAGARYNAYTRREAVGVVAGIVPWNFPLMIALWKVMPALAAGNSIIIKPADETPLTALRIAALAIEAGVPAGVFNVLIGRGSKVGAALVAHPGVNKVSFTGSTAVGKQVGVAALQNMTRFSLELGGKNPMLLLDDADLEKAVGGALMGGLLNQGQVCAAASRFFVPRRLHEPFLEALSAAVSGMTLGAGLDPSAQINPLVSRKQQRTVLDHLQQARQQGARVVAGGAAPDLPGFFVQPTVLDVNAEMSVAQEEVFGPVLSVLAYDDLDEAVRQINASHYGLTASIWSNDLTRTLDLIPRIEAGTVWVNSHVPVDPNLPFGGYKQSGIGREFGRGAVEAFTELKSVCIAY